MTIIRLLWHILTLSALVWRSDANGVGCLNQITLPRGTRPSQKCPFPCGSAWTPSNTWFFESAEKRASRSDQPFFEQLICVPNTQTDTRTCDICSNGPHLVHYKQATWPNNINVVKWATMVGLDDRVTVCSATSLVYQTFKLVHHWLMYQNARRPSATGCYWIEMVQSTINVRPSSRDSSFFDKHLGEFPMKSAKRGHNIDMRRKISDRYSANFQTR